MQDPPELLWQSANAAIVRHTVVLPRTAAHTPPATRTTVLPSYAVAYDREPRGAFSSAALGADSLLAGALCLAVTLDAEAAPHRVVARYDPVGADAYGGGELAGALRINGRRFTCWNTDAYAYDDSTESMYQSHPWVMLLLDDGSTAGVFVDTTYKCDVDLTTNGRVEFAVDLSDPALLHPAHREVWSVHVYQILAIHPADCANALARLTGFMPLPPLWALGYQQCRWSYDSHDEALTIARQFRERKIPCDVIWFDIDYMDKFRVFTFDEHRFPNPAATNAAMHELGFKTVWMIDPGIACGRDKEPEGGVDDPTNPAPEKAWRTDEKQLQPGANAAPAIRDPTLAIGIYQTGLEGDHFIRFNREADASKPWRGAVWPGLCVFPDFARRATRDWWAQQFQKLVDLGVDGVWNDMNEIAVFSTETKTMDLTAWHRDSPNGKDSEKGFPHAYFHNAYGSEMAASTRSGLQQASPNKRPFVLTRAGCMGYQRHAATWTGDNGSDARHFRWSVPMALRLGLSGQPFVGPDIGGFFGDASARLFARWCAVGAMLPLARAHTAKSTAPHEPWEFGEECEATCRVAIARRYRLLPAIYTAFRDAHRSGVPVVRPLFYADPCDPVLRDADSGFLLGDDILVATPSQYFSDTLIPEEERLAMEKRAEEAKKSSENAVFGDDGPLAVDPDQPFRTVPPKIEPEELRDAHGTPLPGGVDQWMLLDDAVDDGIDMTGATVSDLPLLYARRGSCVALGPSVNSTSELEGMQNVVDVVVALVAEPGAMAVGVVYEDAGDGFGHQKAGEYRETTYHAAVLDSLDHVVVQRRVTGGGASFGPFGRVRVLCSVGSRQTAVGIIQPSDDTLELYLPSFDEEEIPHEDEEEK